MFVYGMRVGSDYHPSGWHRVRKFFVELEHKLYEGESSEIDVFFRVETRCGITIETDELQVDPREVNGLCSECSLVPKE